MGIQGLLPLLKSILNPIHIKELQGHFVAVDTYSWLHKGALSCSTDLCKGQSTSRHIDYCMHRVNLLRHYGVKPILVFDGGPLPMKSEQEIKRARVRKENLSRAMEHEANGNKSAAFECYQKAVDISPSVAYDLIQVLKKENVSYIVAPYEADAQMTFLALNNHVDAVITEDSDLIAFGCPRIIYKMDKFGQGVEFKNALLQHNKDLNLAGFTHMMLLEMCIFSGCDYLQSLPGMGLKKAHSLMKKFRNHQNVIKHLKYNNVEVTPLYEESFRRAILTFRHQRVYDPVREDMVHLSEPVDIVDENLDFLGPSLSQHVAKGIASGNLDPFTKDPIQREPEVNVNAARVTYQLKNFKPDGERKRLDLPAQKNLLTNYFCFASLEAKRKFRAPQITSSRPNESNEIFSHSSNLHEINHEGETDDSKFTEAQVLGPHDDRSIVTEPLYVPRISVCKPCISLHKDLDSDQETARKEEKRVVIKSRYFLPKNTENANSNEEMRTGELFVEMNKSDFVANDTERSVENIKRRVGGSCIEPLCIDEYGDSVSRGEFAVEPFDGGFCESLSDDRLEGNAMKKRKFVRTDSPIDGAKENKWSTDISGSRASDIEDDNEEEEKMACNISHLGYYSDVAAKSMERFVSFVSSFKYSSSGSRASGLRAPLKEIKNDDRVERSTIDVSMKKFEYAASKRTAATRCFKNKI